MRRWNAYRQGNGPRIQHSPRRRRREERWCSPLSRSGRALPIRAMKMARHSFLCYVHPKLWNSANVRSRFLLPALYVGVAPGGRVRFPGAFPTERESANESAMDFRRLFSRGAPGVVGDWRIRRHARHQDRCPVGPKALTRRRSEGGSPPPARRTSASNKTGSRPSPDSGRAAELTPPRF